MHFVLFNLTHDAWAHVHATHALAHVHATHACAVAAAAPDLRTLAG
jgi:hypothetical protein